MKNEVRIFFDQYHGNEVFPKSLLAYFGTLIPKMTTSLTLKEFRTMSLLGNLYKLLSKVLVARLSKAMNSIISKSQSAFLKRRYLVGGVMIVNEVVDLA